MRARILKLVEQVDLADALAGHDVLADLGIDGRQEAVDRRAHFEAVDDPFQQLEAQGEPLDGLLRLRELVAAEHVFALDALLQELSFALEAREVVARRLDDFCRNGAFRPEALVARMAVSRSR